ncbi:hypothetical protein ACWDO7_22725 [Streptomyces sp. NPDC003656]|uniref:hypothetical protein n=1 Tax=Streptomyces sp. NPDC091385 TaxID=3365997 RepID=UPI0038025379
MADLGNEHYEQAAATLIKQYAILRALCLMLPVPITLVKGTDHALFGSDEAVASVQRIVEILTEQPMPAAQRGQLSRAACCWLTAMDELLLLDANYTPVRLAQTLTVLEISGTALDDLYRWCRETD